MVLVLESCFLDHNKNLNEIGLLFWLSFIGMSTVLQVIQRCMCAAIVTCLSLALLAGKVYGCGKIPPDFKCFGPPLVLRSICIKTGRSGAVRFHAPCDLEHSILH